MQRLLAPKLADDGEHSSYARHGAQPLDEGPEAASCATPLRDRACVSAEAARSRGQHNNDGDANQRVRRNTARAPGGIATASRRAASRKAAVTVSALAHIPEQLRRRGGPCPG
jgi:hypothetical protein